MTGTFWWVPLPAGDLQIYELPSWLALAQLQLKLGPNVQAGPSVEVSITLGISLCPQSCYPKTKSGKREDLGSLEDEKSIRP